MKLSTLSRYGFRAVVELAKHSKDQPVSLKSIATAQNIPIRYLENIMTRLVSAGIVRSIRGRGGGFILKKDPNNITIYEVLQVLEDTLAPIPCIENPTSCKRYSICGSKDFLEEAYISFVSIIKNHTIKEVSENETLKIKINTKENGG